LLAVLPEDKATLIDQALDLHDRMIGALFNRAKRRHAEEFQQSGEAIHEKVRLYWRIGEALPQARESGADPFPAIEAIIPWEAFVQSVTEAQRLARVEGFDYLQRISEGYTQIRRYAPAFLDAFRFKAAPAAQPILEAIETLKAMDADGLRRVPVDSPILAPCTFSPSLSHALAPNLGDPLRVSRRLHFASDGRFRPEKSHQSIAGSCGSTAGEPSVSRTSPL